MAHDFNGDGFDDILFQHRAPTFTLPDRQTAIWSLESDLTNTGIPITPPDGVIDHPNQEVVGVADFNGDGKPDLLYWGYPGFWGLRTLDGTTGTGAFAIGYQPPIQAGPWYATIDVADFNADNKPDILVQNQSTNPDNTGIGAVSVFIMDGVNPTARVQVGTNPGASWHAKQAVDINDDHKPDLVFQNDDGSVRVWTLDGLNVTGDAFIGANPGSAWHFIKAADLTGDNKPDFVFQNDDGSVGLWKTDGFNVVSGAQVGANPGAAWHLKDIVDVNRDGKSDILFQHDDGTVSAWLMDGTDAVTVTQGVIIGANPGPEWHIV